MNPKIPTDLPKVVHDGRGFTIVDDLIFAPSLRAVRVAGREIFHFTKSQALAVEVILEHLEMGFRSVPVEQVLRKLHEYSLDKEL